MNHDEWYEALTQEEKDSLDVKICWECWHTFDDNPEKNVCKTCEEWVVQYEDDVFV